MAFRDMNAAEISVAEQVFWGSINYDQIHIADDLGWGDAPWASPPGPWSSRFVLHVGPGYEDMSASGGRRKLLIHELTHVWQGQNAGLYGYVLNSAAHQTYNTMVNGSRGGAYSYEQDWQWYEYSAEQQASIAADWFAPRSGARFGARSIMDWRYRYIKSNIRAKAPNAESEVIQVFEMRDVVINPNLRILSRLTARSR